jgi:hypothetical protein
MGAPTDYAVTTATRDGGPVLTIAATITDSAGWLAFAAAINAQADALGFIPEEEAPAPRKNRRNGQGPKFSGPPADGTFDARVLSWARGFVVVNGHWPAKERVAQEFEVSPGIAAMRIGRLRKRGVWGVAA